MPMKPLSPEAAAVAVEVISDRIGLLESTGASEPGYEAERRPQEVRMAHELELLREALGFLDEAAQRR